MNSDDHLVPKPTPHFEDKNKEMKLIDGVWTFKAEDGITYCHDPVMNVWFVQVTDDLLKAQQSAYAVDGVDDNLPEKNLKRKHKKVEKERKKKDEIKNTAVYVTGIPPDASVAELVDLFQKAGVFFIDPQTGQAKIKLYKDNEGNLKGDALIMYLREESVALACDLLDDTQFRVDEPGKIRVQPAEFRHKDPALIKSASKNVDFRKKQKVMQKLNRQLEWDEDAEKSQTKKDKNLKLVYLKGMFTLKELEKDPTLLLDLKQDVREECEKLGIVTNLEEEGVMAVRFKEEISAQACVKLMNGRLFGGERIQAFISTGKEQFLKSKEDEEAEKRRKNAYDQWLETSND